MKRTTSALLVALLLAAPGCVAVAVGAAAVYGAIKYSNNEATQDYQVDLDTVWQATIESMSDLGYDVSKDAQHGPTEGVIERDDAWVKVEQHAGGMTRVRVRVGTFETDDHKRRARLILEGIAKRLS